MSLFTKAKNLNPAVFFGASAIILAITLFAFFAPVHAAAFFSAVQAQILALGGWFYVAAVAAVLLCMLYVGFSRFGVIRLGPDHATPDYSRTTWFAMLFSAGMGIGLMFYGVAEPVMHFLAPPDAEPQSVAAARAAMNITFFHWGLHAWAIYAAVALLLAVYAFRHGLPLTLRSVLYPLIGERIYGKIGDMVDIFAITGTLFGVATSLGVGVSQVNAGLAHLFPAIPESVAAQTVLIVVIMLCAMVSVATGLDKGIKILSELNLGMAFLLMLFILFCGPTVHLLQALVQNTGEYLSGIVQKTFNLYAYRQTDWIGGWTILYWAWWLSWAPFVGMFIARVSRGRTIREFVVGVLFIPTGFTLVWMTVFGNSAIHLILNEGMASLGEMVNANVSVALFAFLEALPLSSITGFIALVMVVLFFITSADSGAMVIDTLACNGSDNNPVALRIYWSLLAAAVAIALLWAGGLGALQAMTIASALPFTLILLFAIGGLFKMLAVDLRKQEALQYNAYLAQAYSGSDWRERLHNLVDYPGKNRARQYLKNTVAPAMQMLADELPDTLQGTVSADKNTVRLTIHHGEEIDFVYAAQISGHDTPSFEEEQARYYRVEIHLREGGQGYDIMGWNSEAVINDILAQYQKHMHFLHNIRG